MTEPEAPIPGGSSCHNRRQLLVDVYMQTEHGRNVIGTIAVCSKCDNVTGNIHIENKKLTQILWEDMLRLKRRPPFYFEETWEGLRPMK